MIQAESELAVHPMVSSATATATVAAPPADVGVALVGVKVAPAVTSVGTLVMRIVVKFVESGGVAVAGRHRGHPSNP